MSKENYFNILDVKQLVLIALKVQCGTKSRIIEKIKVEKAYNAGKIDCVYLSSIVIRTKL